MRVEAKICGLTLPGDAAFAANLGAWRLGVVFASGPRVVTIPQARAIVDSASGVPVLGVFGSQPVRTMLETVAAAGLAGVQLHGEHDADVARQLRAEGIEVWRVLPIGPEMDFSSLLATAVRDVDAVLFEAQRDGGSGGKGIAIALDLARAARLAALSGRVVLAGGLTADNVGEAIGVVQPDAVDVSSGIESSPGHKDRDLLARFLENVRAARSAD